MNSSINRNFLVLWLLQGLVEVGIFEVKLAVRGSGTPRCRKQELGNADQKFEERLICEL
jgi:hypothetical protein